jgi:hypothetical protein
MSVSQRAVVAVCAALAFVVLPVVTTAQDTVSTSLKAQYIYRFAQFTEWPADALPPAGPLTMCVIGDTAVRDALERTVKGVTVSGRTVVVAFGQADRMPSPCHTMYVSGIAPAQAARLVAGLREVPVLTISDLDGFNRMGGIAEFFFEAGQLRFAIRPDAVSQSRLQISSRLLVLARRSR